MIYSEAIVSQLFMLNWWEHDPEESQHIYQHLKSSSGPHTPPQILQHNVIKIISRADTYYVSQEIADVLVDGFDTLPDTPLGDIRPSSPYGWVLFEKPVICPFPTPFGDQWQVQAMAWGPIPVGSQGEDSALNILLFVHDHHHTQPLWAMPCISMGVWPWADGWNHWKPQALPDLLSQNLSDWTNKLIFSFFAFIRQECVTIQNQPAARPIRRHLPKSYAAEPIIKVIQLRRRSTATNGDESVAIDYSCRWLVRGHWRNQFYPGSKSHRPRYIQPYVKGPDDKPLKPTKSSLFAVVR